MRIVLITLLILTLVGCQSGSINKRLSRLEQQMSSKAYLEIEQSVAQLGNEVRNLRGELEQQAFQLKQLRKAPIISRGSYFEASRLRGCLSKV